MNIIRMAVVGIAVTLSAPALAGGIGFVDFQTAVTQLPEAARAQQRLEAMYAQKLKELQVQQTQLQKDVEDYESKKLILTDDAKAKAEQELMRKSQELQQTMVGYQNDMDRQVAAELQKLDQKLRDVSSKIAKERGYDLVLDKAVVVYAATGVTDMTADVIKRYNAGN